MENRPDLPLSSTSNLSQLRIWKRFFNNMDFAEYQAAQPVRSGSKKGRSLERSFSFWRRKMDSGFAYGEGRPLPRKLGRANS